MVFRPERLLTLITALQRVRLIPKRLRFVHQTAEKAPSAVLIECRKGGALDGMGCRAAASGGKTRTAACLPNTRPSIISTER